MGLKRLMAVVLSIVLWFAGTGVTAWAAPEVSASSYLVMDAASGTVLLEQNAHERRPMASTTKIMTTLLALEEDLDAAFEADEKSLQVEGSSMGLLAGDQVTLRDLCYGMMLSSGNDSANLTATQIAGSTEEFAKRMNERAEEIGMQNTQFKNPSGLPDEEHYSTAYDMALLAREALQSEAFAEICSTEKIKLTFGNPPAARWLENHNRLLTLYEGCIGLKTGFTKAAGRCLVSAAERDGRRLVCVTLNAPDDWNDHTALLDAGFARETKTLWNREEAVSVSVTGGTKTKLSAHTAQNLESYTDGEVEVLTHPFCYAPIAPGDVVGTVRLKNKDGSDQRIPLLADEGVEMKLLPPVQMSFWESFCKIFAEVPYLPTTAELTVSTTESTGDESGN